MKKSGRKTGGKSRSLFFRPVLMIAIAASVALLIIIFVPDPSTERLFTRFYDPTEDYTLVHFKESPRGDAQAGVLLYFAGKPGDALDVLGKQLDENDPDPYISLFYALACMEEGCKDNLVELLEQDFSGANKEVQSALKWYSGLYVLKQGDRESARSILNTLILDENPYSQRARKLLRKMD